MLYVNGDKKTIALIKRKLENANRNPNSVENLIKEKESVLLTLTNPQEIERATFEYDSKIKVAQQIEQNEVRYDIGCFQALVGLPDTIGENEYRYNSNDINANYYGTKWDIDYSEFNWDFDDTSLSVSFETAWSPPIAFVEKLVLQYKGITDAELHYEEGGCNFAGRMVAERDSEGNVTFDDDCLQYEEGLYKYQDDYFWDRMYDEVRCALEECDNDKKDIMDRYSFVSADDLKEIEKTIDEIILELQTEKNEQEA